MILTFQIWLGFWVIGRRKKNKRDLGCGLFATKITLKTAKSVVEEEEEQGDEDEEEEKEGEGGRRNKS